MKRCLFLGYKKKDTRLISFLKKKGFKVILWGNKKPSKEFFKYDLIICFGYRRIIGKEYLKKCLRPIINLHISYLPYNKGAHPNFWSFMNNTPKGVSIIEIDKNIDIGKLIYRKKIFFKKKVNSFELTYTILKKEIEKLFIKKFDDILLNNYKTKIIKDKKSFHKKSDLPKFVKSWKITISEAKKQFNKFKKNL